MSKFEFEEHLDPDDPLATEATAFLGGHDAGAEIASALADTLKAFFDEHVIPAIQLLQRYGQDPAPLLTGVAELLRAAADALERPAEGSPE